MIDRTTKFLLTIIALGLWANAATGIARPAMAQSAAENYLNLIYLDINALVNGGRMCRNTKICD